VPSYASITSNWPYVINKSHSTVDCIWYNVIKNQRLVCTPLARYDTHPDTGELTHVVEVGYEGRRGSSFGLSQGNTNTERQVARATKFCAVATDIDG